MNSVLYPLAALVGWIAAGYKLWDLRHDRRNPALIALCAALVLLAVVFTISTPAIWLFIDQVTGIPNLSVLLSQGCVMLFTLSVLIMLLLWLYPLERAWPKIRRRLLLTAAVLTVMVGLFLYAPQTEERPTDFVAEYAGDPNVAIYLAVYIAAFAVVQVEITRLCLRYAKVGGRPWLRRGLRITAAGAVLGLVYCAARVADIIGSRMGLDPHDWEFVARLSAGLGVLFPPIGWTIPSWGPRLSAGFDLVLRHRTFRLLYPLWTALYLATPQIALDPPAGRYRDRLAVRDLDFRLYRRVIEIRDGRLALRPHFDPAVRATALRLGGEQGLSGTELDAVGEAAVLAAALRAKSKGHVSTPYPDPAEPALDSAEPPHGTDLAGETQWLVMVARAFTGSPIVRAALAAAPDPSDPPKDPSADTTTQRAD